jgi:hypothetical protein
MMKVNSTERRRRIRRAQEMRALFLDVMGVVGLAFAGGLLYLILTMLSY